MADSAEQQLAKVIDDAVARREPTLPRWASARVVRLLRDLDADERREVVERICARPQIPPGLAANVRAAAENAAGPPPTPSQPEPPPPPAVRKAAPRRPSAPRSAPRGRPVQARTFKGRNLADVPQGTLVEYLGRYAVVEPPWLVLDDGRKFQFLNPAAVYVNGGVEVNGWDVWKVADGRSIGECFDSGDWPPA